MSMYVDMLSSALEAWNLELDQDELLAHVLDCRSRMLATGTASGASAYEALAAELAYDRALIQICGGFEIAAVPASFDQPEAARARLEQQLTMKADVDLVALSRDRHGRVNDLPLAGDVCG